MEGKTIYKCVAPLKTLEITIDLTEEAIPELAEDFHLRQFLSHTSKNALKVFKMCAYT